MTTGLAAAARARLACVIALCAVAAACRDEPPGEASVSGGGGAGAPRAPGPAPATPLPCEPTTASVQRLFAARCAEASCHGSNEPSVDLDLVSPGLEGRLVNVVALGCRPDRLLVPGAPERSLMYTKVAEEKPECGVRMPVAPPPLPASEIECIRAWIARMPPVAVPDGGAPAATPRDAAPPPPTQTCPTGQTVCGGGCVDLARDGQHCGACGRACTGGTSCVAGTCACPAGQMLCGGTCVDTKTDPRHCGGCGRACMRGTVCASGTCVRGGCSPGTTDCNGACVDTATNALHCGGCNMACPAGATCAGGMCGCGGGLTACGGACVDTATDAKNCGGCGMSCPPGTACAGGTCGASCASGTTLCPSGCVSTATDPKNCGACGKACAAGENCVAGTCTSCGPPVSYAGQIQPIWNASCTTNCHGGTRPSAGLDLTAARSWMSLVNAPGDCGRLRVVPGSPGTSYLLNKLTGQGMCSGTQMPSRGVSLPAAQIEAIRGWICQGAPRN